MAHLRFNFVVGIIRNYHLLEYLQLFSLSLVSRCFTCSDRLGDLRATESFITQLYIFERPCQTNIRWPSWHRRPILYTCAQITFVAAEVTTSYMYKPRLLYLWLEVGVYERDYPYTTKIAVWVQNILVLTSTCSLTCVQRIEVTLLLMKT